MILFKLRKKYAKTHIVFEENIEMDPKDKWFIDVKKITKSGIVKNCDTIIRKDINSWLNSFLSKGWEIYEDEPEKEEK